MTERLTFRDSIRWRAAVLTSTVVAVVLTALIWYVFARVTRDLIAGGIERAQTAASVLAGQTAQSTQQGLVRLQDLGRDAALRDYLRTANDATKRAALSALARASLPGQDGTIELWDAAGQERLKVGLPEATTVVFPPDSRPSDPGLMPLVTLGGQAFSHAVVEIPGLGSEPRLGLVIVTRLIRSPGSPALLQKVVGNGATVLIGNQGAEAPAAWTDLERVVPGPAIDVGHPGGGEFQSGTGEREIGAWAAIGGTPWVLLVELPRRIILAPASQLLQRLIAVGLGFLVLATFAASTLSRRVTQPLADLTLAVQALEQGEYGRRVLASGRDELGQLSQAFNAMAQQIETGRLSLELRAKELAASRALADQANQAKDDFLAVLSHELRTPLSAMLGWCHLLRAGTLSQEGHDRAIEVIERNALSQLRLVNDLLDISRIVVGKFAVDLQPADPVAVVREAVASNQPAAERRNISLSWDIDPAQGMVSATVLLDPDRLQQAVDNLVANAIKFTPRGGSVQVSVRRREARVEIAVRDDGEGIAPDALFTIFDRLRQGENGSKRRHAGLGLGLAIVRQIVELHHGTVSAESPGLGRGSTFRIQIPVHEASDPTELPHVPAALSAHWASHAARSVSGIRILVVEDADDSRDFLRELLTRAGAAVTALPRAATAIQWLEDHRADAIVSDIEMPDLDGLAMMRAIRASAIASTRLTPAVALSAYASLQDRTRSLAAGYQVHLSKPVVVDELLATLVALVTGHPDSGSPSAHASTLGEIRT